jgi:UDP-2,4-diacetamido-2,4,6-trideoxy-beta-L-altropyranose hydrolase
MTATRQANLTPALVIRADAGVRLGSGHVMRCLALAQEWRARGGAVTFLCAELGESLERRLRAEGMGLQRLAGEPFGAGDAAAVLGLAGSQRAAWAVVDGYGFGADYQRLIRAGGERLLVLDDYGHAGAYDCDAILNQNLHADQGLYANRAAHTQLLLGPRFALLRREFQAVRPGEPSGTGQLREVLVTLGGSDPDNLTRVVLEGLVQAGAAGLHLSVVVGGANPHWGALQAEWGRSPAVTLLRDVPDLPARMAAADLAVSAAGSTCWELCCLGVPFLTVVTADNQRGIARALDQEGVAQALGEGAALQPGAVAQAVARLAGDVALRQMMSHRGRALVDGRGAARVVDVLAGRPG